MNGAQCCVVDSQGSVIYATDDGAHARARSRSSALLARRRGRRSSSCDARAVHVVGAARPLGSSTGSVAVEAPFETAFAPVFSVVTRVFVIDLCIILAVQLPRLSDHLRASCARSRRSPRRRGASRRATFELEVPEPRAHDEIGLLTRTFNDMMRKLRGHRRRSRTTNRNLLEQNAELQRANEVLNQLSITDGLTKLHNHRFFQDHLTREIKRVDAHRTSRSRCC